MAELKFTELREADDTEKCPYCWSFQTVPNGNGTKWRCLRCGTIFTDDHNHAYSHGSGVYSIK